MRTQFPFICEKVRGELAARKHYGVKRAEDDGLARGATPDSAIQEQKILRRGADMQTAFDMNAMFDETSPMDVGVLHGALNQIDALPVIQVPPSY